MAEPVYHLGKLEMKATLFLDDRSMGELNIDLQVLFSVHED